MGAAGARPVQTAEARTGAQTLDPSIAQQAGSPPVHVSPAIAEARERVRLKQEWLRAVNRVAVEIRQTSWGKDIAPEMARAIAEWGRRFGVDVVTEIYVLGGNIYFNAQFYLNRLAPYIQAGLVEGIEFVHFHEDDRLLETIAGRGFPDGLPKGVIDAAIAEASAEWWKRRSLRIKHNVPEVALAACECSVKWRDVAVPFIGAKFVVEKLRQYREKGSGQLKTSDSLTDPVGVSSPMESVETRSLRRSLRLAIAQLPALQPVAKYVQGAEDDAAAVLASVATDMAAAAMREESLTPMGGGLVDAMDGYGTDPVPQPAVQARAAITQGAGDEEGRYAPVDRGEGPEE